MALETKNAPIGPKNELYLNECLLPKPHPSRVKQSLSDQPATSKHFATTESSSTHSSKLFFLPKLSIVETTSQFGQLSEVS